MEGEREPSILRNSRESAVFCKLISVLRTLVKHPVALKKINLFCILDTSNSSYVLMRSLHNWAFTSLQNGKSVLFWKRKPAINGWKGFVIPNHKLFIRSAFNKLYTTLYTVFIPPPQGTFKAGHLDPVRITRNVSFHLGVLKFSLSLPLVFVLLLLRKTKNHR